jgi:hypothetical protein
MSPTVRRGQRLAAPDRHGIHQPWPADAVAAPARCAMLA